LSIFPKHIEKIRVSLRSDNNNGYFTWRTLPPSCAGCLENLGA